jgi:hypothetical protein
MSRDNDCCSHCGADLEDVGGLIRHELYGWGCAQCLNELERIERETDWDEYEQRRRERIAEANEY